jgi:hypothetical protein
VLTTVARSGTLSRTMIGPAARRPALSTPRTSRGIVSRSDVGSTSAQNPIARKARPAIIVPSGDSRLIVRMA